MFWTWRRNPRWVGGPWECNCLPLGKGEGVSPAGCQQLAMPDGGCPSRACGSNVQQAAVVVLQQLGHSTIEGSSSFLLVQLRCVVAPNDRLWSQRRRGCHLELHRTWWSGTTRIPASGAQRSPSNLPNPGPVLDHHHGLCSARRAAAAC